MKKMFTLLASIVAGLSFCLAQSGTLDSSFGKKGMVKLQHGDSLYTTSVTIEPDNKILAGSGYKVYISRVVSPYHFIPIIQRYKSNGTVDRQFGINGETYLPYYLSDDGNPDFAKIDAINVLPNKKILVTETSTAAVGNDYDMLRQYYLCRLNSNGVIDSSFGTNGYVADQFWYNFHQRPSYIWNVHSAIQTNEKIVVAVNGAFDFRGSDTSVGLKRYKANGVLDSSFGTNGVVFYGIDYNTQFQISQVTVLSGGKILIAGTVENIHFSQGTGAPDTATNYNFVMARFLNNGTVDSSFGMNGLVKTPLPDLIYQRGYNSEYGYEYTYPSAVAAIQTNGDIVVSGTTFHNNNYSFTSVGYYSNGTINHNFGYNGFQFRQSSSTANNTYVAATAITDNNILVGGTTNLPDEKIAIIKYLPDGSVDNSFGKKGFTVSSIYNSTTRMTDMQVQSDEKIVAAAITNYNPDPDSSYNGTCYLLRYNNSNSVAPAVNASTAIAATPVSNLLLSPNPVNNVVTIQGLSAASKIIVITDVSGKTVRQISTANTSYSFNVASLPAGVYFMRVNDDNKTNTLRFIKE